MIAFYNSSGMIATPYYLRLDNPRIFNENTMGIRRFDEDERAFFVIFCVFGLFSSNAWFMTIEIESFSPWVLVEDPKSSLNLIFLKKCSLISIVGPDKDSPRFIEC